MVSDDDTPSHPERAVLPIGPHRVAQQDVRIARQIAELAAELGLHPSRLHIDLKPTGSKRRAEVQVSIPQEYQEQVIQRLGIKRFDPNKDTVTIGGLEVTLDIGEHGNPWAGAEGKRRSKPKSSKPDRSGP